MELIVSLDAIKRLVKQAADKGLCRHAANPYPRFTSASMQFYREYLAAKVAQAGQQRAVQGV